MKWPWQRRYNPDNSSTAVVLSTSYGSPDTEKILPTFQSYTEHAYAGNAVVFGVILSRISLFSEVEFAFQDRQTGKLFGFGTPDLELLERPYPNQTTGELLCRMEQDASLAGNAYIRNIDGLFLERLRPDRVTIVSAIREDTFGRPYRVVIGYAYDRNGDGSGVEFYTVDEVAHWSPIPDPLASFRGMSWLTPVVREINADNGLTDYKIKYLENAATPNLLVKYDKMLKPSTIADVEERVMARHGGLDNAFKVLVLDNGADATVIGNSFEQMSFTTVQAAGENRIAVASGVPGIVAGLKEGLSAATYSNYGQAMRRFADLWGHPQWRSASAALEKLVTVPPDARLWFDKRNIPALQAGEQERADVMYAKAKTANVLIVSGYQPDSVTTSVESGDMGQLVHTGALPTTLYQDDNTAGQNVDTSSTQGENA